MCSRDATVYAVSATCLIALPAGVDSPEKYAMVIGKAWFAGPKVLDLANPTDPLFQRISKFLHDPKRESKGWYVLQGPLVYKVIECVS